MYKNIFAIILMAVLVGGCASGSEPVLPGQRPQSTEGVTQSLDSPQCVRNLWGLWECIINTKTESFEIIPLRSSQYHFNVSEYIDGPPPTKFGFFNFVLDKPNSKIDLDVAITHPFPGKPNLTGFDVHGIIIGPGSISIWEDNHIVVASSTDTHLLNPDGWTRWWNPVEFDDGITLARYRDGKFGVKNDGSYTATLNAYKLFADGLSSTADANGLSPSTRAVFTTGATNIRHYSIWFPMSNDKYIIKFNYAVDASWAPIPNWEPGKPINVITDFPPEANQQEAFKIEVQMADLLPGEVGLYYKSADQKGGIARINIKAYDWQGFLTPADVAPEIAGVKLEGPTFLSKSFTGTLIDPGSGTKAYAEYQVVIDGKNLTKNGVHTCLITVVSKNGDYQPDWTKFDSPSPLAAYKFWNIEVSNEIPPNQAPTAIASAEPTVIFAGQQVTFDASASNDADGSIVLYEWDFNGDGVFGDVKTSGTDIIPIYQYNVQGDYYVDLKVTDNGTPPLSDQLDTKIHIKVNLANKPPVAIGKADKTDVVVGEKINFDGCDSYDPDGSIVSWEWDFNGDGVYEVINPGCTQIWSYDSKGQYEVGMRVTDNLGASAVMLPKIKIYVTESSNTSPVAVAEVIGDNFWEDDLIEFNATGSYDPDGSIVEWLWDFNNDGIFGDAIDGGTPDNPLKAFPAGDHTVNLKVVDNDYATDTLDTLLTFYVESHVVITLEEDAYYKSVNGYEYAALNCATPDLIPINYTKPHGPWDFVGPTYLPDPEYVHILPPSHPEVASYIPQYFPYSTSYFIKYNFQTAGALGELFLGEEPDFINQILKIHGHIEHEIGSTFYGVLSYDADSGGPMLIQFPMNVYTDQNWKIIYYDGSLPMIEIHYSEVGVGQGWCRAPIDNKWHKALLTRTFCEFYVGGELGLRTLHYKWTADDGRQLARLYATNDGDVETFNPYTFLITGESRLVVLKKAF